MKQWQRRKVPEVLVRPYISEGWWTDDSLGDLFARGLGAMPDATFAVHSGTRTWRGAIADVERAARRFAGGLAKNWNRAG
jgi:acyl-CoA synthetase